MLPFLLVHCKLSQRERERVLLGNESLAMLRSAFLLSKAVYYLTAQPQKFGVLKLGLQQQDQFLLTRNGRWYMSKLCAFFCTFGTHLLSLITIMHRTTLGVINNLSFTFKLTLEHGKQVPTVQLDVCALCIWSFNVKKWYLFKTIYILF